MFCLTDDPPEPRSTPTWENAVARPRSGGIPRPRPERLSKLPDSRVLFNSGPTIADSVTMAGWLWPVGLWPSGSRTASSHKCARQRFRESIERIMRKPTTPSDGHRLRLFRADAAEPLPGPRMVPMRVADLVALLGDAKDSRRTWLADFFDDEIRVSEDLYEVLSAYQRLPKGA